MRTYKFANMIADVQIQLFVLFNKCVCKYYSLIAQNIELKYFANKAEVRKDELDEFLSLAGEPIFWIK